ncbi:double C2-like domain-containing protein gamma isoform X4 [Pan troglodytes]|uniref:double C2-like domain-containing protein gamma isoform X4 n=1 Tax=Pan troglodytes TaxID=9598 RepID=UPI0007DBEB51|nr:double C2-like domain-containing protein gamma isoform X4 [Pan troglodytes]
MAGTAAAGGQPPRVSMQEHMAIDVSPGPIRPIRLISHYFPHFYPFFTLLRSLPCTLRTCAPQRRPPSTLHPSCSPTQSQKETQTTAASQLRTRTVQGTRVPVWEETLTYHGFTRQDAECKTLRLCVCEDPWLQRQRQAPSLGELRVPLRKLVPNRARSFDICLEKRRLEFFYSGPREELAQKTLLVSVWDYDLGTADDFIGEWEHEELGWGPSRLLAVPDPSPMAGGVQLGSHASGERLRHWLECLGHSDHRLELWHPLDSKPVQLSD